jgi:Resolvase, N terminal domain/DDE domain
MDRVEHQLERRIDDGARLFRIEIAPASIPNCAELKLTDQQTLPLQLAAMRDYIVRRDWKNALEIQDVGSGASLRPKREELLKAARCRELDRIVVWRLDRWGRSLLDLVTTLTGATIDFLLSALRDAAAAKRLLRQALSDPSHPQPRVINTDKARLYGSAIAGVKEEGTLRSTIDRCNI